VNRLVAFCGIDGAGKSTLVQLLASRQELDACVLKKEDKHACELVARHHARQHHDARDWETGPFAAAVALATAIDFLSHYTAAIVPALARQSLVIVDRYTPCYEAYLESTGYPYDAALVFAGVRPADLVVYVETPVELALARCQARGSAGEDETAGVQRRFAAAYERVLARAPCSVVRVRNDGSIEDAYAQALAAVRG
jgi:thymidylate kinase